MVNEWRLEVGCASDRFLTWDVVHTCSGHAVEKVRQGGHAVHLKKTNER